MSSIFSASTAMSSLSQSQYFTWGLTALSIGFISAAASAPSAQAQTSAPYNIAAQRRQTTDYTYRYVHPTQGNDANPGTTEAPLRSITQALATAPENTIIVLAAGTYSTASGEQFPLVMKSGVTIQGQPSDRGQNVIISGSGYYLSRSFARQNITVLGANRSGLRGVTVTNPQPQGYGLWIESTSPVISDSTFAGSTHDGVSIVGSSAPILKNNVFTQNGANGLTIYGYSHPELVENTFENTGFGINIAQNAAPRLTRNRILGNKDGIVIQGNAAPILRQNIISNNRRDGLVAISNAKPHLGNTSEAGDNQFSGNGNLDINAAATNQVIPAVGNQFGKSNGKLDRAASTIANVRRAERVASLPGRIAPIQRISDTRIGSDTTDPLKPELAQTPIVPPAENAIDLPLLRLPAVPNRLAPKLRPIALPVDPNQLPPGTNLTSSGRSLPIVPELRVSKPSVFGGTAPAETGVSSTVLGQPESQPEASGSIPIAVPAPEASIPVQTSEKPRLSSIILADRGIAPVIAPVPNANILPVPSGEIPIGNTGGESTVWRSPAPRPNFQLRVYVAGLQPEQVTQLKQLIPGAFNTRINGQTVVQIGAFNDRASADALANQVSAAGFTATIENY